MFHYPASEIPSLYGRCAISFSSAYSNMTAHVSPKLRRHIRMRVRCSSGIDWQRQLFCFLFFRKDLANFRIGCDGILCLCLSDPLTSCCALSKTTSSTFRENDYSLFMDNRLRTFFFLYQYVKKYFDLFPAIFGSKLEAQHLKLFFLGVDLLTMSANVRPSDTARR